MMTILETVNVSTGRNTATEDKFPNRIATGAFDAGFATKLMAKDLRLYEASVTAAGAPRRLAGQLREDLGRIGGRPAGFRFHRDLQARAGRSITIPTGRTPPP